MRSSTWALGIIGLIVLIGGYVLLNSNSPSTNTPNPAGTFEEGSAEGVSGMSDTPSQVGTDPDTGTAGAITIAAVATHNTAQSCWTVIDGNVYDLTQWISRHPGGERAILGLCGTDGTAAFHGQHKDNQKQADILAGFKIGTLAQ